jgi:hypothetical protein
MNKEGRPILRGSARGVPIAEAGALAGAALTRGGDDSSDFQKNKSGGKNGF